MPNKCVFKRSFKGHKDISNFLSKKNVTRFSHIPM